MAAAFDLQAPMTRLLAHLAAFADTQAAQQGIPESVADNQVVASVSLGGGRVNHSSFGTIDLTWDYFVEWTRRLDGDEQTAETKLAAWVSDFVGRVYGDLTLSGSVAFCELDASIVNDPRYQRKAGAELRVFPLLIHCRFGDQAR